MKSKTPGVLMKERRTPDGKNVALYMTKPGVFAVYVDGKLDSEHDRDRDANDRLVELEQG